MSENANPESPAAAAGGQAPSAAAPASAATPAPLPPTAAARPAAAPAAKPAAPAKGAASPNAPRPSVVYSGLASIAVEDIVAPFTHVARAGETVEALARDYYGSRAKAAKIRDANPDLGPSGQPQPGQRLKIPKG